MRKTLLAFTALASLIASPLQAATANGWIILYGEGQIQNATLTFLDNGEPFQPVGLNQGGDLAIGLPVLVALPNLGQPMDLTTWPSGLNSDLFCGSNCLFAWGNPDTVQGGWLNITTAQLGTPPLPDTRYVDIFGEGVMSFFGLGYEPTHGIWSISALNNDGVSPRLISYGFTATPLSTVPIPAAAWLFGSGLAGMALIARRRKRKSV